MDDLRITALIVLIIGISMFCLKLWATFKYPVKKFSKNELKLMHEEYVKECLDELNKRTDKKEV